jgi:hypothetical protein
VNTLGSRRSAAPADHACSTAVNPDAHTIQQLFERNGCYIVPLYQGAYVFHKCRNPNGGNPRRRPLLEVNKAGERVPAEVSVMWRLQMCTGPSGELRGT